jgi:hypothetical protein
MYLAENFRKRVIQVTHSSGHSAEFLQGIWSSNGKNFGALFGGKPRFI